MMKPITKKVLFGLPAVVLTAALACVYCQALADKIGVMISTLSAFRVPTSFSIPEIYQA